MLTNSFKMLQSWMIDFMYDMCDIWIDSVTRTASGIAVYAHIPDVSTIKSDIDDTLQEIEAERLFKDLHISIDNDDEINIEFKDGTNGYLASIARKNIDALSSNNDLCIDKFVEQVHTEIVNVSYDFDIPDTHSGTDWSTEMHNQLLLILHGLMQDSGIPFGNKFKDKLWKE